MKIFSKILTGGQSTIKSTKRNLAIAEAELHFNFLFKNIAKVALWTSLLMSLKFVALLNFFVVNSAILYIKHNFVPFRS